MDNLIVFKFFGVITFLFELGMLVIGFIGRHRLSFDNSFIFCESTFFLVMTITGIGLLFGRKWAAIVFSFGTLSAALFLIIGSVMYVPLPWCLINIFMGAILLTPTMATVQYWRYLSCSSEQLP